MHEPQIPIERGRRSVGETPEMLKAAGPHRIGREVHSKVPEVLMRRNGSAKDALHTRYGLTLRELEIVKAAVSGYSNREIADRYRISASTVKHHITNIFDKLSVCNRLELFLFVHYHRLLEP